MDDAAGLIEGVVEPIQRLISEITTGPADTDTLNDLAEATGGRFYNAESAGELRAVYSDIGSSIGYRTEQRDISARFIGLGLLAAVAAAAGSLAWFSRLP